MKFITLILSVTLSFANIAFAEESKKKEEKKATTEQADYQKKLAAQVEAYQGYLKKIEEFEKSDKFKKDLLTTDFAEDISVGKKNAPIKIVEYASLSCVHCKEFHDKVYYNLKKDFIDSGKVYYKFRNFPLNAPAVKATLLANCAPEASRAAFVGALFKSQSQWAYTKNESGLIDRLKTISKIGGLSSEQFEKCYNNEEDIKKLLARQKEAIDGLGIESTPTIFVDGNRYLGSRNYEDFKKMLEEKLANQPKKKAKKKVKKTKSDGKKPEGKN
ncbi:MAG: DsbA family protein [Rickettsiales bacterium]|nr:DsbA family protein [Rickettsiales bacterium]